MLSRVAAVVAAFALLGPGVGPAAGGDQPKKEKAKKPALEIRPTPRFAFSPANELFATFPNKLARIDEGGAVTDVPLAYSVGPYASWLALDASGRILTVVPGMGVVRFHADGSFDRTLGLGDAIGPFVCHPQDGCYLTGRAAAEWYVMRVAD